MKANIVRNRKGMTLVETLIAAGLLCLVLVGTVAVMTTTLRIWAKGASGTSANSYASLAMRKLVLEIEEGKVASVVSGRLVVDFPYYDSGTDDYVRTAPGVTATYYRSGPTGAETSGELTYLWKSVGVTRTRLARNIESISFIVPAPGKLVRITLTGTDREGGAISPNLVQQSVKLRNS